MQMKSSSISSSEKSNLGPAADITKKDKGVITAFEEIVGKHGKETALVYNDDRMTYEQVNKQANQLAHYLIEHVKTGGDKVPVIGVYLDRSIDSVISMLAIFKAGFIYLPLPISSKPLEDYINCCSNSGCGVTAILSHDPGSAEIKFAGGVTPIFLNRDETKKKIKSQQDDNLPLAYDPQKTAFIIFSSGSSGKPKGIRTPHADLLNCILAAIGEPYNHQKTGLNVKLKDRVPHLISIGFDASIMEIMLALLTGAELHIMPRSMEDDVADFLFKKGITVGIFTASRMKYIMEHRMKHMKREDFLQLRAAIVTAEGIPQEVVNFWTDKSGFRFIAGYGVSEVTIGSTLGVCEKEEVHAGKPMHDKIEIYICTEDRSAGNLAIPKKNSGEEGEIYIVSPGLGEYLIPPDAPVEEQELKSRFCKIKVSGEEKKAYQTRDKGKINDKGQLIVMGRLDRQLQIYGETFCPEEIENALEYSNIDEIKHIAVDTTTIDSSDDSFEIVILYACVFISQEVDDKIKSEFACLFSKQLKEIRKTRIPVRWIFEVLHSDIKLTANGKLDRAQIPGADMLKSYFKKNKHYRNRVFPEILPRYIYEQKVAKKFQEIFGLQDKLDVKVNFDDLGGTSLQKVFFINELNQQFFKGEKKLLPAEVPSATIENIARNISELKSDAHIQEYAPDLGKKNEVPLFLVHSLLGDADQDYEELIRQLREEKKDIGAIYTISAPGLKCPEEMDSSIEKLTEYYIKAIEKRCREKHEGQPLIVLGWSAGGVIANAIVKKLQEKGKKAVGIAIDSASPSLLREMPIEHFIEKYLIRLVGYETEGFRDQNRSSKMGNEEWKKGELIEYKNSKQLRSLYLPTSTPELDSEIKNIINETKEGISLEKDRRVDIVGKFFEKLINAINKFKDQNIAVSEVEQKIKMLETMCSILKSLLNAEDEAAEKCLLVFCSNSEAELGKCLGWKEGESRVIQRIENANHFSVMKKDGQLGEILGLLTQHVYRFKVERLANVLRQYYETKAEDNISFFHNESQKASLKEHYVLPKLKVIEEYDGYGNKKKYNSAATIFYPEDLLMRHKENERDFTLIEGSKGVGKTALTRNMAIEWAAKIVRNRDSQPASDKGFSLLVWLSLKDFKSHMKLAKDGSSIATYLYDFCGLKESFNKEGLKIEDIEEILVQAKEDTLYILDDYSEIACYISDYVEENNLEKFKGFIALLNKILLNPHIVLTSRPSYFSQMPSKFIPKTRRELKLLNFGLADAQIYIEKYFSGKINSEQKIRTLSEYLCCHTELIKLLPGPVFFQFLCELWEKKYWQLSLKTELTIANLYDNVIDSFLEKKGEGFSGWVLQREPSACTWDPKSSGFKQDDFLPHAKRAIGKIAFSIWDPLWKYENISIEEANVIEFIKEEFNIKEELCEELYKYLVDFGLLNKCCISPPRYKFINLECVDFFVASYVAKEFVQAREKGDKFNLIKFLGIEFLGIESPAIERRYVEIRYDAKYKRFWHFVFPLLSKEEMQIAIDFFEQIEDQFNKEAYFSLLNRFRLNPLLLNPLLINPLLLNIFSDKGVSFLELKDKLGLKHEIEEATFLILFLEQMLQIEAAAQGKGLSAEKKEQYLSTARKRVFNIVKRWNAGMQYERDIKSLYQIFIKTIAASPRLLKENLFPETPQADIIMKIKVLKFYCDLHLLGDSFSDDISSKINKEISDNLEYIYSIRFNPSPALDLTYGGREGIKKMKFDAKKLLSHDLVGKLIGCCILGVKILWEKCDSVTSNISYDLRDCFFRILYNQYLLNPQHLLGLIEKYGRDNATQPEEKEKLKELKEAIIKTASHAAQKANYSGENGSARLPHPGEKISQHSFWCCRVSSPMVLPARGEEAPVFCSKETFDALESNRTSEPSPRIKEADTRRQSIVNQNIPSHPQTDFFKFERIPPAMSDTHTAASSLRSSR